MRRLAALGFACALVAAVACSSKGAQFSPQTIDTAKGVSPKVNAAAITGEVSDIVKGRVAETPVTSAWSIQGPLTHLNSTQYMIDAFTGLGYKPVVDAYTVTDLAGSNVYVEVPGTIPEYVLVTGHHDAWYQAGADDNASALAVLIETARAVKDLHPLRTIRIVAFDREEEGSVGAGAYLNAHAQDNVRMMLNMDCVGYASHDHGSQDAPTGFSFRDTGDFLLVVANDPAHLDASRLVGLAPQLAQPVDVVGLLAPSDSRTSGTGAFLRSDHAPFWDAGVPALFFTDTANYRNHNYHTAQDTPEKLDYDFLSRVAQLVASAAAAFAVTE